MKWAALSLLCSTLALAQHQVTASVQTSTSLVPGPTAAAGVAFYEFDDGGMRLAVDDNSTQSSESLLTYDLTGTFREVHASNAGAVAVDVRYGLPGRGDVLMQVDGLGTITLFGPSSGSLVQALSGDNSNVVATNNNAASAALGWHQGTLYAFVGGDNGTLQQWSIVPVGDGDAVSITKVRSVAAGMSHRIAALTADELTDTLYLSIDSLGIATLPMTVDGGINGLKLLDAGVAAVGPPGLSLYLQADGGALLLASDFAGKVIDVFDRRGTYFGNFQIVADGGIFGVNGPVGNAVWPADAGVDVFPFGVFAVVDSADPAGPFVKLVPWEKIATAFTPPLPIGPGLDLRQLPHGLATPMMVCDAGSSDGGEDGGATDGGSCGAGGGGGGGGTGGGTGGGSGTGGNHLPGNQGEPVVDHHCGCDAGGGALLGALWLLGLALRRKLR